MHIAPGTYATGTIANWIDDPALGRTYEITDYAWVSRAGRMSLLAKKIESEDFTNMLVEYIGGPPTRVGAHDIIRATPIAKPITESYPQKGPQK
jgi:hypothetical protein